MKVCRVTYFSLRGCSCLLGLVFKTACLLTLALGCSRQPVNEEMREELRSAIKGFTNTAAGGLEAAKAAIHNYGDAAIPYLRSELELDSKRGNHFGALAGLRDLGSDASFSVLVEVLEGRTRASRRAGHEYITSFITANHWTPDRARAVPGFLEAALDYVGDAKRPFEKRMACRFAALLSLRESIGTLREYSRDSDYEVRLSAADAICSLTGNREVIQRPPEKFIGEALSPALISCSSRNLSKEHDILDAHLGGGQSAMPVLVVAFRDGSRTLVRTYDMSFKETGGFAVPLIFRSFLVSPIHPGKGQPWIVAMVSLSQHHFDRFVVAYDRVGAELWRFQSPEINIQSLAWLFDEHERPQSVVVSGGGTVGVIKLSLSGEPRSQEADRFVNLLRSERCVPEWVLAEGIRSLALLDSTFATVHKTLRGKKSLYIRAAAILPLGNGRFSVAATRRGSDSLPELTLYDSSLTELWSCYPAEPIQRLAALSSGCGGESLLLGITHSGELLAFDAMGVLRWRGLAFGEKECSSKIWNLESWYHATNPTALVLANTRTSVSICKQPSRE